MYVRTYLHPLADVDECSEGTHNCTAECMNTQGGFQCSCSSGYQLSEDEATCKGRDRVCVHTYVHNYMLILYVQLCS